MSQPVGDLSAGFDYPLVLDGHNRLAACKLADVEPRFESVNGADPLALVVSLNVKRRNLSAGQRAIAAGGGVRSGRLKIESEDARVDVRRLERLRLPGSRPPAARSRRGRAGQGRASAQTLAREPARPGIGSRAKSSRCALHDPRPARSASRGAGLYGSRLARLRRGANRRSRSLRRERTERAVWPPSAGAAGGMPHPASPVFHHRQAKDYSLTAGAS